MPLSSRSMGATKIVRFPTWPSTPSRLRTRHPILPEYLARGSRDGPAVHPQLRCRGGSVLVLVLEKFQARPPISKNRLPPVRHMRLWRRIGESRFLPPHRAQVAIPSVTG